MIRLSNGMTVQELWEEYHKYKRLYEKLANYVNFIDVERRQLNVQNGIAKPDEV